MLHPTHPIETAADALRRIEDLRCELALAGPALVAEIRNDLTASEELYIGLAVTEIASLRAQLGTKLLG